MRGTLPVHANERAFVALSAFVAFVALSASAEVVALITVRTEVTAGMLPLAIWSAMAFWCWSGRIFSKNVRLVGAGA